MTGRREFPTKVKVAAFQRANGKCEKCTATLFPGHFTYDHRIPDALGGEPTLENCQVICDNCDGEKTYKVDVPQIAKMKRQRAGHIGARRKSRPIGDPRFIKKFDGTVVPRLTREKESAE